MNESRWRFPAPGEFPDDDLVAIGADLEPSTILEGYRRGLFPMHITIPAESRTRRPEQALGWWSPDPRGIIPVERFRPSRSLRKSMRRFEIRVDTAFDEVIRGCADPARPHGWIGPEIVSAYERLHRLGWARSVEVWRASPEGDRLVGGLYGVAIGGFFAAESKFHRETDASKAAVAGLVALMRESGGELLDVQWATPHLERLGAIAIPRSEYLARLSAAVGRARE